jgi:hypothetical protein
MMTRRQERSERLDQVLAELGADWMLAESGSDARRRAARRIRLAEWVLGELDDEQVHLTMVAADVGKVAPKVRA